MIEIYDECKSAIINKKCSECNEFYSCYICDFVEERYQQGRADQKEEDNEFFNFEGAWELEKKKVRADAIDEFADYVLDAFAPLFTKEELINCFKEQLKEQQ